MDGFSDPHDEAGKCFELTLPSPAVRPTHWTDSATRTASIISISWTSFKLNLPSPAGKNVQHCWQVIPIQPPDSEHHQHQLESFLNLLSYLRPFELEARLAVRPTHWTDSATRTVSITSISWKVCKLTPSLFTDSVNHKTGIISIIWRSC